MPSYYRPKNEFEIVTQEKLKLYLNKINDLEFKALLSLAWLTGARISELLEVKKKDFIITSDEIKLLIKTYKQKNHPIRELIFSIKDPFTNFVLDYLQNLDNEQTLFPKCKRTYQHRLQRLNKKIFGENKNEYITFHYLRHSLISYLARELRASAWEIQSWTGHKSSAYEEYIIKTATDRFKGQLGLRR